MFGEEGSKKEMIMCYIAGITFASAWWIWIDATVWTNRQPGFQEVLGGMYVPGIVGTVALFMINAVSWNEVNDNFMFGEGVSTKAKIWLFFSFLLAFGSLIASIWIAVQYWFMKSNTGSQYGGVALIVENLLIFISAMMYRFAKPQNSE